MADSKDKAATRLEKAKDFKDQGKKFYLNGEYVKDIYYYRKLFDNLEG